MRDYRFLFTIHVCTLQAMSGVIQSCVLYVTGRAECFGCNAKGAADLVCVCAFVCLFFSFLVHARVSSCAAPAQCLTLGGASHPVVQVVASQLWSCFLFADGTEDCVTGGKTYSSYYYVLPIWPSSFIVEVCACMCLFVCAIFTVD